MLRKCEFLVSYQAMNVYEICAVLKESAFVRELTFTASLPVVFEPQKSFSVQWDSALEKQSDMLPERRQEEYLRRGRLCRSVGVLAGLMAGIMFI